MKEMETPKNVMHERRLHETKNLGTKFCLIQLNVDRCNYIHTHTLTHFLSLPLPPTLFFSVSVSLVFVQTDGYLFSMCILYAQYFSFIFSHNFIISLNNFAKHAVCECRFFPAYFFFTSLLLLCPNFCFVCSINSYIQRLNTHTHTHSCHCI